MTGSLFAVLLLESQYKKNTLSSKSSNFGQKMTLEATRCWNTDITRDDLFDPFCIVDITT